MKTIKICLFTSMLMTLTSNISAQELVGKIYWCAPEPVSTSDWLLKRDLMSDVGCYSSEGGERKKIQEYDENLFFDLYQGKWKGEGGYVLLLRLTENGKR